MEWPFLSKGGDTRDTALASKRMLAHMEERTGLQAQPIPRELVALGLFIEELRGERGLSRQELAERTGLDPGFLAILEEGLALEKEVTEPVLKTLARGLGKVRMEQFDQFFPPVQEEEGKLVLLLPSQLAFAVRSAAVATAAETFLSDFQHDENTKVSYRIGAKPDNGGVFLAFCRLRDTAAPLPNWEVSLRASRIREVARGVTDEQGRFFLPAKVVSLPRGTYAVLKAPDYTARVY